MYINNKLAACLGAGIVVLMCYTFVTPRYYSTPVQIPESFFLEKGKKETWEYDNYTPVYQI